MRIKRIHALSAVSAFFWAASVLFTLRGGSDGAWAAAVCHVVSVLPLFFGCDAKASVLAAACLAAPLVGVPFAMCVLFIPGGDRDEAWLSEFRAKLAEGMVSNEAAPQSELWLREAGVFPIVDVLAGDDVGLKRGAVFALAKLGTPYCVSLLKRCLTDDSHEVRFVAHSQLTEMEDVWTERLRVVSDGDDVVGFGVLAMEYVASGLPDEASRATTCRRVVEALAPLVGRMSTDGHEALATAHEESGGFREALRVLDAGRCVSPHADFIRARIALSEGDGLLLGNLMSRLSLHVEELPASERECVETWLAYWQGGATPYAVSGGGGVNASSWRGSPREHLARAEGTRCTTCA